MRPVAKRFEMHFGFNEEYPDNLKHLTHDGLHYVDYIINSCYTYGKRWFICQNVQQKIFKEPLNGIEKIQKDEKKYLKEIMKNIIKSILTFKDLEDVARKYLKGINIFVKNVMVYFQKIDWLFIIKTEKEEIAKKKTILWKTWKLYVEVVTLRFITKALKTLKKHPQRRLILVYGNH